MEKVEVETFLDKMTTGVTAPSLVLCDDGHRYVLKKEEENGEKYDSMFLNEVLSYKIAKHLDIPVPDCAIATIDKELVDMDRDIIFVHRFNEGMYFASKEELNVINNVMDNVNELKRMGKPYIDRTWNDFFRNIENKKDIAKVIAFDLLIANFDRFNHLNNFLVTKDYKLNRFIAIDHGHSFFGPNWSEPKMRGLDGYSTTPNFLNEIYNLYLHISSGVANLGVIFKGIEQHVDVTDVSNHDFTEIIHEIESIDENLLSNFFEDIPEEWFVNKQVQIKYYTDFLLHHKNNVKILIQMLTSNYYFTNYKGGVLQWKIKEQKDCSQL